MRKIYDKHGSAWILEMELAIYRRIRAKHIPDFLEDEKKSCEQLADLSKNRIRLCEVLWEFCQRQAVDRGVSEEEFFCSFAPEVLNDVFASVVEAVADFFPHIRPMISRTLEEIEEAKRVIESELRTTFESIPRGKLAAGGMDGLRRQLSSMRESPE